MNNNEVLSKTLELAMQSAQERGSKYITPEHVLGVLKSIQPFRITA